MKQHNKYRTLTFTFLLCRVKCFRYVYVQVSVETHVIDVIREQLSRRQPVDGGSRNIVRTMTATCGYAEVRSQAAQRLDMWLQNPKVTRMLLLFARFGCLMYSVA